MIFEKQMLSDTADRLDEIVESLEEIHDWSISEGYYAIQYKIEEATGRLNNAAEAARQYADGRLTRKD